MNEKDEEILSTQEKENTVSEEELERQFEKEWFSSLSRYDKKIFICMLVLDPLIVVIFFYYLTQTMMSIVLAYVVVDIALVKWQRDTQIEKLKNKARREREGDRREILLRKIQELGEIEAEMKKKEEMERIEKERKKEQRKNAIRRFISFRKNS